MGQLDPVLGRRPLGVFSDIDGTLSPIVERPQDAVVTARCRGLLERLIAEGVHVALITGRQLAVARSMVGIDEAAYAANHGLEFWIDGHIGQAERVESYPSLVEQVVSDTAHLDTFGVETERKGPGVAFHYRRAADGENARAAILREVESSKVSRQFTVTEARKVIELRPRIQANKGTATGILAAQLGVKGIIAVGDDRTDVDMFNAAHLLGEQGVDAVAIAVMSAEIQPEVLASAEYTVEGVEGVEWVLAEVLRAVGGTSP
jgi:trehalose 6-phosphate phosphatase